MKQLLNGIPSNIVLLDKMIFTVLSTNVKHLFQKRLLDSLEDIKDKKDILVLKDVLAGLWYVHATVVIFPKVVNSVSTGKLAHSTKNLGEF